MITKKIKSISQVGWADTLDLEVDSADHNFICNGVATSNSHSMAYGHLTAITAYLKANHTKEFYLCSLASAKNEQKPFEEISTIAAEMSKFGIKLLPPHLLKSNMDFTIDGDNIRFGLLSIKGISDKSISKLEQFRSEHTNKFAAFESAEQAGLGIGVLSALIQAGALEGFKQSRSYVVLEAQLWGLLTDREKIRCSQMGPDFDYDLFPLVKRLAEIKDEKGKPFLKESRMATIKKNYEPYKQIYLQNKTSESFCNWYYERHLLGYSPSNSLLNIFKTARPQLQAIGDAQAATDGAFELIGVVKETAEGIAKNAKKTKWFRMSISDESGSINVLLFNERITEAKFKNGGKLPAEEDIVFVRGKRMGDAIFADSVDLENRKIFMKLRELRGTNAEPIAV